MVWRQTIQHLFRHPARKAGEFEWLHANVPRGRAHIGRERWIATGSVALVLMLVGGLFYNFHFRRNTQFMLRDISIVSGEMVSDGLVRAVIMEKQAEEFQSGDKPGYLFGPNIAEVREELLRHAGIRNVTITRRLPSRMEVRIVEREPVGRIRIDNDDQVIDAEGVIFPRSARVDHLPKITNLVGIPLQAGGRLDGMGLAAVRLLSAIARPEYALPVVEVNVSRKDYLILTLRDQREVHLWWKGMDAPTGGDTREALGKRLKRLLQAMSMAPQRQMWDATVPDDNRIFSPY